MGEPINAPRACIRSKDIGCAISYTTSLDWQPHSKRRCFRVCVDKENNHSIMVLSSWASLASPSTHPEPALRPGTSAICSLHFWQIWHQRQLEIHAAGLQPLAQDQHNKLCMRSSACVRHAWDIRHSKSDPLLCLSSCGLTQHLVIQKHGHH